MKLVINGKYGGFSLSPYARKKLSRKTGKILDEYDECYFERDDYYLISTIEECEKEGKNASGYNALVYIVEIPDEVTDYKIMDYDGNETLLYVLDGKIHYA